MGSGAVFIGNASEMLFPVSISFLIAYVLFQSTIKVRISPSRTLLLFLVTLLISGIFNAIFNQWINHDGLDGISLLGVSVFASTAVLYIFRPRIK